MPKPPKLTEQQKRRLKILEPNLRNAVQNGDYDLAKQIVNEIQSLLRQSGHETRLMQSKNWLFEAAMESGNLQFAIAGLTGVQKKCNPRTRVYLEATALLAICHIRNENIDSAEPLIAKVLEKSKMHKITTKDLIKK